MNQKEFAEWYRAESEKKKAFREAYNACANGASLLDNPYDTSTDDGRAWVDGWYYEFIERVPAR